MLLFIYQYAPPLVYYSVLQINILVHRHSCSWHDKLIILWTLNIKAKIFLLTVLLILLESPTFDSNNIVSMQILTCSLTSFWFEVLEEP